MTNNVIRYVMLSYYNIKSNLLQSIFSFPKDYIIYLIIYFLKIIILFLTLLLIYYFYRDYTIIYVPPVKYIF